MGPVRGALLCGRGDEEAPLWSSGWGPPFHQPELDEYPKERDKDTQDAKKGSYQMQNTTEAINNIIVIIVRCECMKTLEWLRGNPYH